MMNRRERVVATLQRKATDRVVTDYKGTEEVDNRLMEYFSVSTIDELLICLGADYNHYPCYNLDWFAKVNPPPKEEPDGILRDIWGVGRRADQYGSGDASGTYYEEVDHPLKNIDSIAEVEDYPWPTLDMFDISRVLELSEKYSDVALSAGGLSLFERANSLMGMENVFMNMMLNPS